MAALVPVPAGLTLATAIGGSLAFKPAGRSVAGPSVAPTSRPSRVCSPWRAHSRWLVTRRRCPATCSRVLSAWSGSFSKVPMASVFRTRWSTCCSGWPALSSGTASGRSVALHLHRRTEKRLVGRRSAASPPNASRDPLAEECHASAPVARRAMSSTQRLSRTAGVGAGGDGVWPASGSLQPRPRRLAAAAARRRPRSGSRPLLPRPLRSPPWAPARPLGGRPRPRPRLAWPRARLAARCAGSAPARARGRCAGWPRTFACVPAPPSPRSNERSGGRAAGRAARSARAGQVTSGPRRRPVQLAVRSKALSKQCARPRPPGRPTSASALDAPRSHSAPRTPGSRFFGRPPLTTKVRLAEFPQQPRICAPLRSTARAGAVGPARPALGARRRRGRGGRRRHRLPFVAPSRAPPALEAPLGRGHVRRRRPCAPTATATARCARARSPPPPPRQPRAPIAEPRARRRAHDGAPHRPAARRAEHAPRTRTRDKRHVSPCCIQQATTHLYNSNRWHQENVQVIRSPVTQPMVWGSMADEKAAQTAGRQRATSSVHTTPSRHGGDMAARKTGKRAPRWLTPQVSVHDAKTHTHRWRHPSRLRTR